MSLISPSLACSASLWAIALPIGPAPRIAAEVIDRSGILAGRTPWFPGRDPQINEDRKLS